MNSGLSTFRDKFHPTTSMVVGTGGVPLDEFLQVGVEKLFAACRRYFEKTGRRISFEYAMIDGVNDHDWQADLLAEKIHGMPGHVNLIPLNDVVESEFKPSKRVAAFQKRLETHGLTATVRRSLGGDIDASCGQLRRKEMKAREGVAQ